MDETVNFKSTWILEFNLHGTSLMQLIPRGWVFRPQVGTDAWIKDRRKDAKQCVPSFCENNPFRKVVRETVPFHCLNFAYPEQWVHFLLRPEKTNPFLQKIVFSNPKRWQRSALPSSEKYAVSSVFVQASVPSCAASALPESKLDLKAIKYLGTKEVSFIISWSDFSIFSGELFLCNSGQ